MKKTLLVLLSAVFVYMAFSSNSGGTALVSDENRTGSTGGITHCSDTLVGCHVGPGGQASNSLDVNVNITLRDMFGDTVAGNVYYPNALYDVIIWGNIYSGSYPEFGFQFAATSEFGLHGGTFTPKGGIHSTVVGNTEIIEQNQPLSTTGFNNFHVSFQWRAPGPGNGNWRLFATVLGANGDGQRFGDIANNEMRILKPVVLSVDDFEKDVRVNLYPVPAKEKLNLKMESKESGQYTFTIYDLQGKILDKSKETIVPGAHHRSFNINNFPAGSYFMEILKDGKRKIISFQKQ